GEGRRADGRACMPARLDLYLWSCWRVVSVSIHARPGVSVLHQKGQLNMIEVRLPDGSARKLDEGATAEDLATQIGPGLVKAAVVARVNGLIKDLSATLADGDEVSIIT